MGGVVRGMRKPPPFPVGAKVGEITVVKWASRVTPGGRALGWQPWCQCSCGWEGFVYRENLLSGRTTRCNGCAKIAANAKRYWKYRDACPDDATRIRLLNRLSSCIARCHNPKNSSYGSYGGRGIDVWPAWRTDRTEFLRHAQTLPGFDDPNLELDRVDNNLGYVPGNLRFVTRGDNVKNRRTVAELQAQIQRLTAENADLRRRLRGAEE